MLFNCNKNALLSSSGTERLAEYNYLKNRLCGARTSTGGKNGCEQKACRHRAGAISACVKPRRSDDGLVGNYRGRGELVCSERAASSRRIASTRYTQRTLAACAGFAPRRRLGDLGGVVCGDALVAWRQAVAGTARRRHRR